VWGPSQTPELLPTKKAVATSMVLLNAQWRGGSTLAFQLLFTTSKTSFFLSDEPAFAARALMRANALAHNQALSDTDRILVADANLDVLDCAFKLFDMRTLARWQQVRGNLSGQAQLQHASTRSLTESCHTQTARARAVKTVRMVGSLRHFMRHCRHHSNRRDCSVIQLVRHPLALLKSRLAAMHLPIQPDSSWSELTRETPARPDLNLSTICALMLRDVRVIADLKRRDEHVHLIRYSDLILEPARTAREVHAMLQVHSDEAALGKFVQAHFPQHSAPVRHTERPVYSTIRHPAVANTTCQQFVNLKQPDCAQLIKLAHPLYAC